MMKKFTAIVAMLVTMLMSVPAMAASDYSTSDVQLESLQEQALGFYNIYVTSGRWTTEDGELMQRTLRASINGVQIATLVQQEIDTDSWFTTTSDNQRMNVKKAIKYLLTQRRTTITRVKSNSTKLYFCITGTRAGDSIAITFYKSNGTVVSKVPRLEMENGWHSVTRPSKAKTAIIRIYYKGGGSKKVVASL